MPYGTRLTPEEFEVLERPMRRVDSAVDEFARLKRASVIRNYHNSPDRHIQWCDTSGVTRAILISPVSKYRGQIGNVQQTIVYVFGVVAYKDYSDSERPNPIDPTRPHLQRKWWHDEVAEVREMPADDEFMWLLESGYEILEKIRESQLMPACA